jgi:glycosyltransferase involved in cell wall biosynthesis
MTGAPPRVAPLPADRGRTTWSVMIPVFNAGPFLADTLRSVLVQDRGRAGMQIAVVDDASTDVDVRRLVEQVAGDRVEYHRQSRNVGSVRNFNTGIGLSRGQLVHLLHADDRVLPGYYETMEALFATYPQAGAGFSGFRNIDEQGAVTSVEPTYAPAECVLENWFYTIAKAPCTHYGAIAVRRSVYETLGGFFGASYGEDWEMKARIASRYPVAYTPDVLAEYRVHPRSITRAKVRSGGNLADLAWVVDTIQGYLPDSERSELRSQAETSCARLALHYAGRLWHFEGDSEAANRQLEGALRFSDDDEIRRGAEGLRATMAAGERNPS